jgi:hypothetical protein
MEVKNMQMHYKTDRAFSVIARGEVKARGQ